MNAYESGARKSIPAVLIYARFSERILMIHRNAPARAKSDYHAGKWNGLGGKCEPDESIWEAASREFAEESGVSLPVDRFLALGVVQFPNFKAHRKEDWLVSVLVVELTESEAAGIQWIGTEGSLHWVPEKELLELNLWPGDRFFVPHVILREPFCGTIWYQGEEVVRQDVRALVPNLQRIGS